MAIDSYHKKWSLTTALYDPDGGSSLDANDKLLLAGLYSGLTLSEESIVTLGFADVPQPGDAAWTWDVNFSSILEDMCTYLDAITNLSSSNDAAIDLANAAANPTDGSTFTPSRNMYRLSGSGGAVTIDTIADGAATGQLLCLVGTDDTNTVTIADGSNTEQNSDITLGDGDVIVFVWDGTGSNWTELYRNS